MQQQQMGASALRQGVIFGVIGTVLTAISSVITLVAFSSALSSGDTARIQAVGGPLLALSCVTFLLILALTFIAGILAARQSGSVGAGALAGMYTGLITEALGFIIGLILSAAGLRTSATNALVLQIVGFLFGLVLYGGLGAGLGALGGLIGRNSYQKTQGIAPAGVYGESFYQGMQAPPPPPQYPGQPQYPAQPQYPGQPQYPAQQPSYPQYPQQTPPPPQYPQ